MKLLRDCWAQGLLIVCFESYCLSTSSALYVQVWVQKKAVGGHRHLHGLLHLSWDGCVVLFFLWMKFIDILVLPVGMASKSLIGSFMLWDGRT